MGCWQQGLSPCHLEWLAVAAEDTEKEWMPPTLRDTPRQRPPPPIPGHRQLPALQHSLDLGWGDTHGVAANPQGAVGNGSQVALPILNPQLGGSWGERAPQAGTTLRPWHRDVRAAQGWGVQDPSGTRRDTPSGTRSPGRAVCTLDVQAVAERGVACSVGGCAGVETSVCHLGLGQDERS